jgi:hypothetical protein
MKVIAINVAPATRASKAEALLFVIVTDCMVLDSRPKYAESVG